MNPINDKWCPPWWPPGARNIMTTQYTELPDVASGGVQSHGLTARNMKKLQTWANHPELARFTTEKWGFLKAIRYSIAIGYDGSVLGGPEGRATALRALGMDKDGDGKITDEEKNASADEITESINSMLVNFGVIATLLFSMVVPMATTAIEPSVRSVAYFGEHRVDMMSHAYIGLLQTSMYLSALIIVKSIYGYKQLNFWMINADSRLRYASHFSKRTLPFIVIPCTLCMVSLGLALPLGSAILVSPLSGAISFAIGGLFLVYMFSWIYRVEFMGCSMQQQEAKKILDVVNANSNRQQQQQ